MLLFFKNFGILKKTECVHNMAIKNNIYGQNKSRQLVPIIWGHSVVYNNLRYLLYSTLSS